MFEYDKDVLAVPEDITFDAPKVQNPQMWDETMDNVRQLTSGKLPDEVVSEIKRRTAEQTQMQGLGIGRMAGQKSLRNIGLSAMEQFERGTALGLQAGQVEGQWAMQEADMAQRGQFAEVEAQQKQRALNLDWLKTTETLRLGSADLAQKSAAMLSANRQARMDAEIKLTALHAQYKTDVQKYLTALGGSDTAPGYFDQSDRLLAELTRKFNYKV